MSAGSSYASSKLESDRVPDKFPVGMKVLLVDDDLTCLAVVKRMLLHCQYDGLKLVLFKLDSELYYHSAKGKR
ncbi:hypothetical protein BHE74_00026526 [Ensete ventricosum]|nr:hypothetical protein BHE74_00026526 [Ensete ventricosum]